MRKFYAGYNDMSTDIAVFNSAQERDNWINEKDTSFERIPLTRKEAIDIVGRKFFCLYTYQDELDEHIVWIVNPVNIVK